MTRPVRLGMLTPSSNTALEPMTYAMLAGIDDVSAHFSRFKVTEIALSESALRQFDASEILRAAELLAHAKVDVIAWNGTSASWLGFDRDESLCEQITASTGIKASTTVLAYRDLLRRIGAKRIGLVTPYRKDVQDRIIANWNSEGLHCFAERHLALQDNFSFAEVSEAEVARLIEEVVREGCDAAVVLCTNMRGAGAAARLERGFGVPVLDSIAVTLWACLAATGCDPSRIHGWGSLFSNPDLRAAAAIDAEEVILGRGDEGEA
ncbi:aspartate/glutamate racemase family protein [Bradyrhizobium sp. ISRA443]|uniref:maleate cis-trans isomerase family protein n=1 Tax=unclassified Bradyrhizobium TaxID=2631580 RepID=UPI0024795547|nr:MULTISPECIES: aspartate/glutamate racemase family protein [unclassified Bradyrhizobium]WGS02101.1 aspartate/glutamate racemase family protein [Bradyrhizobium sp. ISRA436]WGS08986.1 aspartate/glutamate racemase family protein [Bradyrhizobium sp. ISRA437]WGS15875.1 aspartate/glutamate racemase family protein [Bradyrhizobium sp. ISRA443]